MSVLKVWLGKVGTIYNGRGNWEKIERSTLLNFQFEDFNMLYIYIGKIQICSIIWLFSVTFVDTVQSLSELPPTQTIHPGDLMSCVGCVILTPYSSVKLTNPDIPILCYYTAISHCCVENKSKLYNSAVPCIHSLNVFCSKVMETFTIPVLSKILLAIVCLQLQFSVSWMYFLHDSTFWD